MLTVGNDAARVERMLGEGSLCCPGVRGAAGPVGACPEAGGVRAGPQGQGGAAAAVPVHCVPGDYDRRWQPRAVHCRKPGVGPDKPSRRVSYKQR